MRRAARPLVLLVALLVPLPSAAASAGVVQQGESDTHRFDNEPDRGACVHLMTTWTVTLTYAPPTDVLTLSAGGATATGSHGLAQVSFPASVCTEFTITVTGTRVAAAAAYAYAVASHAPGAVGDWA